MHTAQKPSKRELSRRALPPWGEGDNEGAASHRGPGTWQARARDGSALRGTSTLAVNKHTLSTSLSFALRDRQTGNMGRDTSLVSGHTVPTGLAGNYEAGIIFMNMRQHWPKAKTPAKDRNFEKQD